MQPVLASPGAPGAALRRRTVAFRSATKQQRWTWLALAIVYAVGTIQWMWCYADLVKPYLSMQLYERGLERMPFQGRYLLVLPMRLVHGSSMPGERLQFLIDAISLVIAGYFTVKLYRASSRRRLLTVVVYPIFLAACAGTYILRTLQSMRYPYDLVSLAFFAAAMYLLYTRKHWVYFAALFVLATTNRETTLLLLLLYVLNEAVQGDKLVWRWRVQARALLVVGPLALIWLGWRTLVQHRFALNPQETQSHFWSNLNYLHDPRGLAQVLTAGGGLLLFSVLTRRLLPNARLRAWFWLIPVWFAFMLASGIVVETRVFGELIPLAVVASVLIVEEMVVSRVPAPVAIPDTMRQDFTPGRLPRQAWVWALISLEILMAGCTVANLLLAKPLPVVQASLRVPTDEEMLGLRGPELLLKQEQFARAIPPLEKFVATEPGSAKAWDDLCEAHDQLHELNQAREACERGLQINPSMTRLQSDLHKVEFRAEVRRMEGYRLEEVSPDRRGSEYYLELGSFEMNVDDLAAARAYQRAVDLDDRNLQAQSGLGIALMRAQRYREAEVPFARVVALEPEDQQARENLEWAMQSQKAH